MLEKPTSTHEIQFTERKSQRKLVHAFEVQLAGQRRQLSADAEQAAVREVARVRVRLVEQSACG